MNASTLVQKLWNYCNVLRDDGMSYGDYVEQLTYLLFLKMADERSRPPYKQASLVPAAYAWPSLLAKDGDELFDHYRHALESLGSQKGTLGLIFGKAQNKFQDPVKLRRLVVDLIDSENWSALNVDVKGDAYEGLLEKNAQDTKSGAGQYFTPRALIQAMVTCIAPRTGERICDPACGTGGMLSVAEDHLREAGCPLDEHRLALSVGSDDLGVERHRQLDDGVEPRVGPVAREHLLDRDAGVPGPEEVDEAVRGDRLGAPAAGGLDPLGLRLGDAREDHGSFMQTGPGGRRGRCHDAAARGVSSGTMASQCPLRMERYAASRIAFTT